MRANYESDLDLNLLRVLVAIADTGSVTRAADKLYLTQPAVSAALRRLQEAIGAPVVEKQGRGIVLNGRGTRLVNAARQHLAALVAATKDSRSDFDAATSDRIFRIGAADAVEGWMVPKLLEVLDARAPHMRIVIVPVNFRSVGDALQSRTVDMAITVADPLPRSIKRRPIVASDYVVICDPRHVRVKRFTERAYFAQQHVIVSYNGDLRGFVEDHYGKTRNVRCSLHSFTSVGSVVEGSSLCATVPRIVALSILARHPKLAMRETALNPGIGALELLWLEANDDDPAAAFMREQVARTLERIPGGRRLSDVKRAPPADGGDR